MRRNSYPVLIVLAAIGLIGAAASSGFLETHEGAVTAVASIAVAVFTFTLWRSTENLWKAGERQAELGQQQFIATFRPHLRVRQVAKLERDGEPYLELMVTNSGGSTATIVDSRVVVTARAAGKPLPARPFDGAADQIGRTVIQAGEALMVHWREAPEEMPFALSEAFKVETNLFVLGYLVYEDGAGVKRRTAFCRIADKETGRFRTLDDPDYEYAD